MDKTSVVTTFLHNIVVYNIPLLYGTVGEIMIEKSGSLILFRSSRKSLLQFESCWGLADIAMLLRAAP